MREHKRLIETVRDYQRLLETIRDYKRLKKTMYLYISFYFLYLVLITPRHYQTNGLTNSMNILTPSLNIMILLPYKN